MDELLELVFVYGSLKKGFHNNKILWSSEYVDSVFTAHGDYRMISFGGFPGVLKNGDSHIAGESYLVNQLTMLRLDSLESNGSFYQREKTLLDSGDVAWMYILLTEDDGGGYEEYFLSDSDRVERIVFEEDDEYEEAIVENWLQEGYETLYSYDWLK